MELDIMQYGNKTVHYVKLNGWTLCGQASARQLSHTLTTTNYCRRCETILRRLKRMQESRIDGSVMMPEKYNQEKMMQRLMDPEVEDVRVFRATPENLTMAEYKSVYHNLNRKQLRARIKADKARASQHQLKREDGN